MTFRPARVGEEDALTDLVLRSARAAWGYSDEFLAWEPDAIVVHPEFLTDANAITTVLEDDGRVIGFYVLRTLRDDAPEMELSRMFVEPDSLTSGCGRRLWDHAVATARSRGVTLLTIDADPNAEPFYAHMGAETIGEHDWTPPMLPDWRVKIMRYAIPGTGDG